MNLVKRLSRSSHEKMTLDEDDKYPEGKDGATKNVEAHFTLNTGEKLGIHLTTDNIISKIDYGSVAAKHGTFQVGDVIVQARRIAQLSEP